VDEREILAVVVWSQATQWSTEILADLERTFVLRDVFRITWAPHRFASNLSRLYGDTLPPGSDKELHSGNGPFLLAVVEDPAPRYARRRATRGAARVNKTMFSARRRYRRLTGGGYRVHATLDSAEADRDLYLILGRRRSFYSGGGRRWPGEIVDLRRDLLGTDGWTDELELLQALEVCGGYVALTSADDPRQPLVLLTGDRWWAERIAQGRPEPEAETETLVAGVSRRVELQEPGDGSLDERWQQVMLDDATRDGRGILVPSPVDRFLLDIDEIEPADRAARAAQLGLPTSGPADPGFAARALAARLATPAGDRGRRGR
jgi:hypothetical protein